MSDWKIEEIYKIESEVNEMAVDIDGLSSLVISASTRMEVFVPFRRWVCPVNCHRMINSRTQAIMRQI